MRTVNSLQKELLKFPDDALCYAYEGEVHGIIITYVRDGQRLEGCIHCKESGDMKDERETEVRSLGKAK